MKQAQQMQAQMAKAQAELEEKTVEVSAAGGKIKVTANGAGEILSIKIDKAIVDPNDVELLEEPARQKKPERQGPGKILKRKAVAHGENNDVGETDRGAEFRYFLRMPAQPSQKKHKSQGNQPTVLQKKQNRRAKRNRPLFRRS